MNDVTPLTAFAKLDIRAGTVVTAEAFDQARKPAIKLAIDFGVELGVKRSSAQIAALYRPQDLIGTSVLAIVNFPPKRIAGFSSEVLVLGVADADGNVVLVRPERPVQNGARLF